MKTSLCHTDFYACLRYALLLACLLVACVQLRAQIGSLGNSFGGMGSHLGSLGNGFQSMTGSGVADSIEERDYEAERARVSYKNIFDYRYTPYADSSFHPERENFFIPYGKNPLGNYGNAMFDYVFDVTKWQPGPNLDFTPYKIYKMQREDIKIYDAQKAFGSLGYVTGSRQQQIISASYTQNIVPTLNVFFDFRFMNSPGFFKNQTTNGSNLSVGFRYLSKKKKYSLTAYYIRSGLVSNENGGVPNDSFITSKTEAFVSDRSTIPVLLGDGIGYTTNPFNLTLDKGRREKSSIVHIENAYQFFSRVDSIMGPDSVVFKIVRPRFRIHHTFEYEGQHFAFEDNSANTEQFFYPTFYPSIPTNEWQQDTFRFRDKWNVFSNAFGIQHYFAPTNPNTYWTANVKYDILRDSFYVGRRALPNPLQHNLSVYGKFVGDIKKIGANFTAYATYYLAGMNLGDNKLGITLRKDFSRKWGAVIFDGYFMRSTPARFHKNMSSFNTYRMDAQSYQPMQFFVASLSWDIPRFNLSLRMKWHRIKNMIWSPVSRDKNAQFTSWINLPIFEVEKLFTFFKHFHVYARVSAQPSLNPFAFLGDKDFRNVLQLPVAYGLGRLYYENVVLKNFRIVGGVEVRYNTPFSAPLYSPVYASYVYQANSPLSNLPQIHVYFKTRVRKKLTFSARLENLMSIMFVNNTLLTTGNILVIHGQPLYQMSFQLGIAWDFVN